MNRLMRHTNMILLVVDLLAFSNLLCVSSNGQVSAGSLSGTVTDTSQAAIPEVRVTIINVATGVARTVATDGTGFYTALDLLPGSYELTAVAQGFTTQVRTGITVNVGASGVVNVVMQGGDPARVVRVSVSGTPVDQASSAVEARAKSNVPPCDGR